MTQNSSLHRVDAPKGRPDALLLDQKTRFDASVFLRNWMPAQRPVRRPPVAPLAWVPGLLPGIVKFRDGERRLPATLGRLGSLEVRLATKLKDVKRAQKLRYKVFYEEMSAVPSPTALMTRRDADVYDGVCDHVLVVDHAVMEQKPFRKPKPKVVATYRLLRHEMSDLVGGFYSTCEYDVAPLIDRHPGLKFLELGRSCVLKPYRNKRTIELLWHGVWTYIRAHGIDAMFGCASLEGTDPSRLALPLSFLAQHAKAPPEWQVRALPECYVEMDRLAPEAVNPKAALHALPPLLKGYLRVGAMVGEGAAVDYQFGTTDVFVILPTARISERYIGYFGADAERHAV